MFTTDLIDLLCTLDDSPYLEWNFKKYHADEKRLQPRQLGARLSKYKLKTKTIRIDETTLKGDEGDGLRKLFKRYIPDPADNFTAETEIKEYESGKPHPPSIKPSQSSCDAALGDFPSGTTTPSVTDRKTLKPAPHNDCDGVTFGNPGNSPHTHKRSITRNLKVIHRQTVRAVASYTGS